MTNINEPTGNGDCKIFANTATPQDITVVFDSSNKSASDTATTKYLDSTGIRAQFSVSADIAFEIIGENSVTYTDPIPVAADKSHTFTTGRFSQIIVRATTASTTFKVVVR